MRGFTIPERGILHWKLHSILTHFVLTSPIDFLWQVHIGPAAAGQNRPSGHPALKSFQELVQHISTKDIAPHRAIPPIGLASPKGHTPNSH